MQIESTTSEIKSTALTTESDPAGGEKKDDENEKAPLGNTFFCFIKIKFLKKTK